MLLGVKAFAVLAPSLVRPLPDDRRGQLVRCNGRLQCFNVWWATSLQLILACPHRCEVGLQQSYIKAAMTC